ncbi:sigma factor-like helix-turn-helix DNA-binding protein [Actinomadura rugatobispora]|uniref:Sigma factor-like helix-turn-helix DNA-binding protein n=1 Tax=Actinomadura rugatobispora TaxID=1994 RepID=A0ABW0ZY52_9ACTN|nr:hypothetical protein GCM10010200_065260 [Actinomadura rugatobispora]
MRGDLGTLYDAHADRLLAHCWSLLGDEGAADAVQDAFVAAVRHPPRGDIVLWLYALSRSACAERDAFAGTIRPVFGAVSGPAPAAAPGLTGRPVAADPLLRAVGALRPDHREALLLDAGEWLEVPDIARVLGIAPDTARGLLHAARTRLERAVVDQLMRGAPGDHRDVITAFEKGRLPHLLARRAPARPPSWLRDRVLEACDATATRPLTEITSPSPLVVIGSEVAAPPGRGRTGRDRAGRRKGIRGAGAMAGMAASVAAAVGLLVSWPSAKSDGVGAIAPSAGNSPTGTAEPTGLLTGSGGATPERGNRKGTAPEPSPATQDQRPTSTAPQGTGSGGGTGAAPAAPAPSKPETSKPDETTAPPQDSPAPQDPSPTGPDAPEEPSTPPDSPAPSDPPDPSQPPSDPPPDEGPEPGPSPTSNPAPSPTTTG